MASIRRTLSPVPRPATAANVDVCSVSSPLSKSSPSPQKFFPSYGFLPSSFTSPDSSAFLLGVFFPRSFRNIEKSKPKGQLWRKVLFHFFICFMVGVSIGLIPLASTNLSLNLISRNQGFSFEVKKFQSLENVKINDTPLVDEVVKFDATLISAVQEQELTDGVTYNISDSQFGDESYLESQKLFIIVTPTYNHLYQAYYLHHLSQTLKLVSPPLLWIVVEMNSQSDETADILTSSGIMYRHLICKMNLTNTSHRSILMRNVAIAHIETHRLNGIVYFANNDNIYSVELFQQMREIRRFGTWTVARLSKDRSGILLQGPICNGSEVIGWHTNNESGGNSKRFHAEMQGFAFNSTILWDPKKWHRPSLKPIRQLESVKENLWVSTLIEQIVKDESEMEGLMNDCSRVMVWNIDLESSYSFYPKKWITENNLDVIWNFPLV
ncbi:putative 1,4-beta-D-xylan synthase [Medicago truncatula]|uniref:Glycosyltransferases n=1 Tax=Medicago truncatula TaxID=3880 RepID=G7ZWJ7_MEDTR|nr:probable beta-1,4-xylosyltransferase IRX9H [Medicago truncatula]XP_024636036.1 probable beta-1,4-xylosyltransferase IRX9H [Medicago truncatula]KEH36042.1 beta-1,4-xylosyltransferase, putative [Medicago truncatula]RHN70852.1 putative 1,4-beta-D-xylan synthase [Medicago truncatula]